MKHIQAQCVLDDLWNGSNLIDWSIRTTLRRLSKLFTSYSLLRNFGLLHAFVANFFGTQASSSSYSNRMSMLEKKKWAIQKYEILS